MDKVVPIKKVKEAAGVNKATEYSAIFERLDAKRREDGADRLVTAMETLIEAIQPDSGLDMKERSKLAEKLVPFESSRAPVITVDYVQNVNKQNETTADESLEDFLNSLRKA